MPLPILIGAAYALPVVVSAIYGYYAFKAMKEVDKEMEKSQAEAIIKNNDEIASNPIPRQSRSARRPAGAPRKPPIEAKIFEPIETLINAISEASKYETWIVNRSTRMEEFSQKYNLPKDSKFAVKLGISLYIPQTFSDGSLKKSVVVYILYNDFFINSIAINTSEYIQAIQSYDDIYFIFHGHAAEAITLSGYLVEPVDPSVRGQYVLFDHLYYSILSGSSLNDIMKKYSPKKGEDISKQMVATVSLDLGKRIVVGTLGNFSCGTHSASQHVYTFTFTFIPYTIIKPDILASKWFLNFVYTKEGKMLPPEEEENLKKVLRRILKMESNATTENDNLIIMK